MIDLRRRGFLFGAVAAAIVVPARSMFIMPAPFIYGPIVVAQRHDKGLKHAYPLNAHKD